LGTRGSRLAILYAADTCGWTNVAL
jgi:hypothetical protein